METARLGHAHVSVRHFDKVGVLAAVFDVFKEANLNVEQMENRIFAGSQAAVALIEVGGEVNESVRKKLTAVADVISVSIHNRQ